LIDRLACQIIHVLPRKDHVIDSDYSIFESPGPVAA
jgi:hypothetical protein